MLRHGFLALLSRAASLPVCISTPSIDSAALSWDLLGSFLAVMRTGSLSGASRTLGVAQPTVRRQIEKLEEVLGAVLFTRSQGGLVPYRLPTALATMPYAESRWPGSPMPSSARPRLRPTESAAQSE